MNQSPNQSAMSLKSYGTSVTSIPNVESSNAINDCFYGEPLTPQHLVMDFAPSDKVDTDFVQEKICAFWDFINRNPELRNLMVSPDYFKYTDADDAKDVTSSDTQTSEHITCEDNTALSVLEFTEEKGMIDGAFEAHFPNANCSFGSKEYDPEKEPPSVNTTYPHRKEHVCNCNKTCKSGRHRQPNVTFRHSSPTELKNLCKTMQDWDSEHPKSMDPPGHPPNLAHSLLQQKMIT